jgi:hypothetical protein
MTKLTKIYRRSLLTGKMKMMELPITKRDVDRYLAGDEPVSRVFLHLNPDQWEFIKSGISPEEWNRLLPPDPED